MAIEPVKVRLVAIRIVGRRVKQMGVGSEYAG